MHPVLIVYLSKKSKHSVNVVKGVLLGRTEPSRTFYCVEKGGAAWQHRVRQGKMRKGLQKGACLVSGHRCCGCAWRVSAFSVRPGSCDAGCWPTSCDLPDSLPENMLTHCKSLPIMATDHARWQSARCACACGWSISCFLV